VLDVNHLLFLAVTFISRVAIALKRITIWKYFNHAKLLASGDYDRIYFFVYLFMFVFIRRVKYNVAFL